MLGRAILGWPSHIVDIMGDRQRLSEEHPLQVARCTKIIKGGDSSGNDDAREDTGAGQSNSNNNISADDDMEDAKYVINLKQIAKFVVKLGERVLTNRY